MKKSNIKALHGYVVILSKEEEKKIGNLIVEEKKAQTGEIGEVIDCGEERIDYTGNDRTIIKPPVSTGEVVVYKKYHDNPTEYENEKYKIVAFEDIIAVIDIYDEKQEEEEEVGEKGII